jgi:transcriptional regulator with XRE-family HTH domain
MIVRKLRMEKGWSQEQLAQVSGLNIRTIQRIETGSKAGLETLKALAAVFDVDITQLKQESIMEQTTPETLDQTDKAPPASFNISSSPFWLGLAGCAVLITFLFGINLATSPGYLWAIWPAMGISFSFLMAHIGRQLAKHYKL